MPTAAPIAGLVFIRDVSSTRESSSPMAMVGTRLDSARSHDDTKGQNEPAGRRVQRNTESLTENGSDELAMSGRRKRR
jgi:hypothetical protein